jgi:hypothetical protein
MCHLPSSYREVLGGDEIASSSFEFKMVRATLYIFTLPSVVASQSNLYLSLAQQVNENCKILCRKEFNEEEIALFRERIDSQYRAQLIIDNLPLATVVEFLSSTTSDSTYRYELGMNLVSIVQRRNV